MNNYYLTNKTDFDAMTQADALELVERIGARHAYKTAMRNGDLRRAEWVQNNYDHATSCAWVAVLEQADNIKPFALDYNAPTDNGFEWVTPSREWVACLASRCAVEIVAEYRRDTGGRSVGRNLAESLDELTTAGADFANGDDPTKRAEWLDIINDSIDHARKATRGRRRKADKIQAHARAVHGVVIDALLFGYTLTECADRNGVSLNTAGRFARIARDYIARAIYAE